MPFLDDATGEWIWGETRALNLEPCTFDGFAGHATLPWEGDRWTIIAYSAVSQGDLASEHEQLLLSCGFPLPWCQLYSSVGARTAFVVLWFSFAVVSAVFHSCTSPRDENTYDGWRALGTT